MRTVEAKGSMKVYESELIWVVNLVYCLVNKRVDKKVLSLVESLVKLMDVVKVAHLERTWDDLLAG
jgi:hypothetical protein